MSFSVGSYIGTRYQIKVWFSFRKRQLKVSKTRAKTKWRAEKTFISSTRKNCQDSINDRTWAFIQALRTTDPKLCVNGLKKWLSSSEISWGKRSGCQGKNYPIFFSWDKLKMAFFRLHLEKCWLHFGYMNPVKGRLCTIGDGGIRDVTTHQTLWKLNSHTASLSVLWLHLRWKYKHHISFMLESFHMSLGECKNPVKNEDSRATKCHCWTVQMNWSPAFYDSQTLGNILKDKMGYTLMIGIARNPRSLKVAAVGTMVNRGIMPTFLLLAL